MVLNFITPISFHIVEGTGAQPLEDDNLKVVGKIVTVDMTMPCHATCV